MTPPARIPPLIGAICFFIAAAFPHACAGTLNWTLPPFGAQLLSDGTTPIPEGTVFQLGVFQGSFVPDAENQADWADNWRAADFEHYDSAFAAVAGSYNVEANAAPFTAGKRMYVWAVHRKADGGSEQWLGSDASWLVPSDNPLEFPVNIDIDDASTVLRGSANPSAGTIRMAAVAPSGGIPLIYGSTWLDHYFTALELADPETGGWQADPDGDGLDNALEFAMGTDPLDPGSRGSMGIQRFGGGFLLSFPGWAPAAVNVGIVESTTLQDPWLPLADLPVYMPGEFRWLLSVPLTHPKNFYRTAVTIPPMP